jgi:hypothetical protein
MQSKYGAFSEDQPVVLLGVEVGLLDVFAVNQVLGLSLNNFGCLLPAVEDG